MQLALMCGTWKLLMEIEILIMASIPLQEKMIYWLDWHCLSICCQTAAASL